jgi:hypothetical protein
VSDHILLFVSAFASVFALGFQSLNVNGGHYLAAAMTSFVIGIGHLALYRMMPDAGLSEIVAYLCGGPLGITASMWVHRRTLGRRTVDSGHRPPRPIPMSVAPPPPPPTPIRRKRP